jgi:UDP-N-acetylglucosamine acyltransferase
MTIDPTARIEDGAVIGAGTSIGPCCIIGRNVVIGPNCRLIAHVSVSGHTSIGADCVISPFVALGGPPQDQSYRGEPTRLEIGVGCTIHEGATMNIGTVKGSGLTRVGDHCVFMNYSHVGHDCTVGNNAFFDTSATLGGHCEVGEFVLMGRLAAVHQFVRIGPQAMIAAGSCARSDVIPFGLANGQSALLEGLNFAGMKRCNFTRERFALVGAFYQELFHGPGIFADRLHAAGHLAGADCAIAEILAFIDAGRHRALCRPAKTVAPRNNIFALAVPSQI